jgi:putative ABC transport system substrate-binding protein
MHKREMVLALLALGAAPFASAQQTGKIPRIAVFSVTPLSAQAPWLEALRQGLREHGYVEGKNIVIEYRSTEGKLDRVQEIAAELVRLNVACIITAGATPTRAAKQATGTIPIVMAAGDDPVALGFVSSLARPGGNVTGLTSLSADLTGKRLELIKEVIPKLSLVGILWDPGVIGAERQIEEIRPAAHNMAVRLQSLKVKHPDELEGAFQAAVQGHANALIVVASGPMNIHRSRITALAARHRLPAIYDAQEFVSAGGLMSYAPSREDMYRRAAGYVDKILKGAKPADLPVERPAKFELTVNLKTAKALGVQIPKAMLFRADHVIE